MNIIIVDDDNLVSLSLKTILEAQKNIKVIAIGKNGNDAIELYKTYLPDILLMDIRMDVMNGLEATEKILENYPQAKILLLTTFSDDEYIIKAIQLGAKGYILKQAFETTIYMLIIWFPMELFICGKILFRKKDMNWGKTAHGLVLEEQQRIEEEQTKEKELQEV